MDLFVGLLLGLVIGALIGVGVMCLLITAKGDEMDNTYKNVDSKFEAKLEIVECEPNSFIYDSREYWDENNPKGGYKPWE